MRGALLALVAWLIGGAPAHAERWVLEYRGAFLGLFDIGGATLDVDVTQDTYEIQAQLQSGGLMALFDRTRLSAASSGMISLSNGEVFYRHYALDHMYSNKRRRIDMQRAPGVLNVLIEPNFRIWGDPPASEAERWDSRDPLSSLVAMGVFVARSGRCGGDYPTFDGRYHYRLELRGGAIRPEFSEGGFTGRVLRCRLRYVPVAGYEPDDAGIRERVPEGEIWFGLIPNAPFAPPVRAFSPLPIGEAGLYLRSYHRPTVDIADGLGVAPRAN